MVTAVFGLVLIFLTIRLGVALYNLITNPLLPYYRFNESVDFSISVLIPARNEENNIGKLLSNLNHIFKGSSIEYEILVLDDHSTDQTGSVVASFGLENPDIRLCKGQDLPQDWLGKNWACHQLAAEAKGNLLLFVDADVTLGKSVILNAVHRLSVYKLDLLSLFPDQKMETPGENVVVPLMHYLLLSLLPLRLVRTSKFSSLSAANGQFMLFNASCYKLCRFHQLVKDNILDDVNIMRIVKEKGLSGEVLLANGQASCRMYRSGKEAFAGFSKNLFPGFGKNMIGFQIYFLLIFWWPVLLCLYAATNNLWLLIPVMVLALSIRICISILSKQSIFLNLVLHPIQIAVYNAVGLYSMYIHLTNKVQWKGRKVK